MFTSIPSRVRGRGEKLRWQIIVYQCVEYFKEKHKATNNNLLFLRGESNSPSHMGWKEQKTGVIALIIM